MIRLTLGDLRLTVLDAGTIWLDGGAMFGVVPKVLWERERRPDEKNRIPLGLNLLLVEDGKRRILVDTGAGSKLDEKQRAMYGIESRSAGELLAPVDLSPERIDLVVSTHLHFDHAGGNTVFDAAGKVVAAFPNARYVVQRGELDVARWNNEKTRASFFPADFEPLAAEGRLQLVEGDVPLTNELSLRVAPGHTPHMQAVVVTTGERTVAFLADLVPTASHVRYPYIMAYDLEPLVTLATKKRFLPQALSEEWLLVFEHDRGTPLGSLEERDGRLRVRPWTGD